MFILLLTFIGPVSNTETTMEWRAVFYQNIMLKTFLLKTADPVKRQRINEGFFNLQDQKSVANDIGKTEMTGSAPDSSDVRYSDKPQYDYPDQNEVTDEDEHSVIIILKKVTQYVTKPQDNRIIDELLRLLIDA